MDKEEPAQLMQLLVSRSSFNCSVRHVDTAVQGEMYCSSNPGAFSHQNAGMHYAASLFCRAVLPPKPADMK